MSARDLWLRLRALVLPRQVERELDDELSFHIEREAQKHVAAGMSLADAQAAAHARFGPKALAAEGMRDARGIAFIETLARDVLYALRGFRRTPIVALTVVATIGVGLGLIAAVFTIFNALVFRSEPMRDPDALYSYAWVTRTGESRQFTFKEYEAFRRDNGAFSDAFARRPDITVRIDGRLVNGMLVTGNYFQVLGVDMALGRALTPADSAVFGAEPVAVLAYDTWQQLYGGDPAVVGRAIAIRGFPFQVVGIARNGFRDSDFWAPLTMVDQLERRPWQPLEDPGGLQIVGRLKPGLSPSAARAALSAWTEHSAGSQSTGVRMEHLSSMDASLVESLLRFSPLFIAFGLILLIGCANVANLMLARALARRREIATRLALGASRARIVRQLLAESLVLALGAAACALAVSRLVVDLATRTMLATVPPEISELVRLPPMPTDWRVATFVIVTAMLAAAMFGLLPALHATGRRIGLSSLGAHAAHAGRTGRARHHLIVVQIASATVLLITAGLLLNSAVHATSKQPGIRMSDTMVVLPPPDERARPAMIAALAAEPRVHAVAAVWPGAPVLDRPREGFASTGRGDVPASYRFVSANYFDVFEIGLVAGRVFDAQEATAHAPVAVVSETAARQLWSGMAALGQTVRVMPNPRVPDDNNPLTTPTSVTIVGVVRDVRGLSDRGDGSDNTGIYLPTTNLDPAMTFIVRARGELEPARQAVTERMTSVEPRTNQIITLKALGEIQRYPLRLGFAVTVVLGGLALALTLSGIYGVLSYVVVQRTREIGVRMALGATPSSVVRMIQGQSMKHVGAGLAIGAALAWMLSAAIMTKMPTEGPFAGVLKLLDATPYVVGVAVILAACLVAAAIPARRAARIDPMSTLRND